MKGLVFAKVPPGQLSCSLHLLGRPCPDSRTNTSKLRALPRNAIPVGAFRPALKTETLNPGGTTMSSPFAGLKWTTSTGQIGFATSAPTSGGSRGTTSTNATTNVSSIGNSDRREARKLMGSLRSQQVDINLRDQTW